MRSARLAARACVSDTPMRQAFRPDHVIPGVARALDADVPTFLGALLVGRNLAVGTMTSVQIAFVCQRVEMAPRGVT